MWSSCVVKQTGVLYITDSPAVFGGGGIGGRGMATPDTGIIEDGGAGGMLRGRESKDKKRQLPCHILHYIY